MEEFLAIRHFNGARNDIRFQYPLAVEGIALHEEIVAEQRHIRSPHSTARRSRGLGDERRIKGDLQAMQTAHEFLFLARPCIDGPPARLAIVVEILPGE